MSQSITYKSKQLLTLIIKLFIVIGCIYFIYIKLADTNNFKFSFLLSKLNEQNVFSLKNSFLLLLFSLLNWLLEIKKWQLLANNVVRISFLEAGKQSLASLSSSLITPNRIGEYGAKALYYKKPFRRQILILNLIGDLFQLGTTILFGLIGFVYFFSTLSFSFRLQKK